MPAPLGYASLTPRPPPIPRDGRSHVMIVLSGMPLGADDTDAPNNDVDDDEDESLQEPRRFLLAMTSGRIVRKLRAWRTSYYALKGSRKERKGSK